ncbi:hypothetical protein C8J57DRAFT_1533889 [Mycena rebaudengoi]|nr:hypothetical protein C8J57DRAFT_1533889 [Mycena rebaudengoi]
MHLSGRRILAKFLSGPAFRLSRRFKESAAAAIQSCTSAALAVTTRRSSPCFRATLNMAVLLMVVVPCFDGTPSQNIIIVPHLNCFQPTARPSPLPPAVLCAVFCAISCDLWGRNTMYTPIVHRTAWLLLLHTPAKQRNNLKPRTLMYAISASYGHHRSACHVCPTSLLMTQAFPATSGTGIASQRRRFSPARLSASLSLPSSLFRSLLISLWSSKSS